MELEPGGIIAWIIVGLIAGWLGSRIMGAERGCVTYLILGLVGAFIGGLLFSVIGIEGVAGLIGSIVVATIGAIALIAIGRMLTGGRAT